MKRKCYKYILFVCGSPSGFPNASLSFSRTSFIKSRYFFFLGAGAS